jgi:hypothetical protein
MSRNKQSLVFVSQSLSSALLLGFLPCSAIFCSQVVLDLFSKGGAGPDAAGTSLFLVCVLAGDLTELPRLSNFGQFFSDK